MIVVYILHGDAVPQLSEAYDKVERKMTVVGATAVEDKLQDGVPETISALREAGIQVNIPPETSGRI